MSGERHLKKNLPCNHFLSARLPATGRTTSIHYPRRRCINKPDVRWRAMHPEVVGDGSVVAPRAPTTTALTGFSSLFPTRFPPHDKC
jgi:hypothetical protein